MATINSLNVSITRQSPEDLTQLFITIRAQRRLRPSKAVRKKSAPAKTKRRPNKRNPKPQDIFALINQMSPEEKAAMAKRLIGVTKNENP